MLLPLVPSVHPSSRCAEAGLAGRQALCLAILDRDHGLCRFCGLRAGGSADVFHVNDDHEDWSESNLAASCPLCHGVQHICDVAADQMMRVVWLPEVSQNALNVVVRTIHLLLHAFGIPAHMSVRPIVSDPDLSCAWRAYAALSSRSASARGVIDTYTPRELAAGLRALSPARYGQRDRLLGGLRLLHRGRHFVGGVDVYPAQLHAWAAASSLVPRHRLSP